MGDGTAELLEYLFGPGKRDEHTDPHLITAWDPGVPWPVRSARGATARWTYCQVKSVNGAVTRVP
ncbi:hypothetical protein ACU4GG_41555 [Streptomyces nojiriensis]